MILSCVQRLLFRDQAHWVQFQVPQLGTAAEEVCQFSRNYCSWMPFLSCCAASGRVKESYSLFSPLSKIRVKVEVVRDWELSRTGKHALLIDS